MSIYYKVVYAQGDANVLTVAQLCTGTWYEEDDYALASDQPFDTKAEAEEHCLALAKRHGKRTSGVALPLLD